jgi:hypothetical protein
MTNFEAMRLGALATVFFMGACAGDDDGGEGAVLVDGGLQQVIGSDGGTIDGSGFPGFEGVRAVFPPGALSADTTVTIRPIIEAEPLPLLGEQCGQSYVVDGGGAALAAPVELTIPVEAEILQAYAQSGQDVKVWVKDGADWEKVEPIATADDRVTFGLPRFTSSAAGLFRIPLAAICATGVCGTAAQTPPTAPACPGPAFCISTLGVNTPPESGARLISNGTNLFHTARPGTNQVTVVRITPSSGGRSSAAPHTTASITRKNLAFVTVAGEAWLGIGSGGNIRFKFDGSAPQAFDTDTNGLGAVALDDGTLTRYTSAGLVTRQAGSINFEPRLMPIGFEHSFSSVRALHADDDYLTRTHVVVLNEPNFVLFRVIEMIPNPNAPQAFADVQFPPGLGPTHRPGLGADGDVTFQVHAQANSDQLVIIEASGAEPRVIDGMIAGVDALVDDRGDVWIAALSTPELALVRNATDDGNRSLEMVPLTSAAPGTAEFNGRMVRSIAELDDGRIAVLTVNGEILLVRRPGT